MGFIRRLGLNGGLTVAMLCMCSSYLACIPVNWKTELMDPYQIPSTL